MRIGQNIKDNRARLGMSQGQLAEVVFVSRQTVSNWETDKTYPDIESLLLMSDLFHVSVDALIKDDVGQMETILSAEAERLKGLGAVMALCGIVTIAWAIVGTLMDLDLWLLVLPIAVLMVPMLASAGMAEKIKHDEQLFTYRSVEAFMHGEDPDVLRADNQVARKLWWGKLLVRFVLMMGVGFCFGWGLMSIIKRVLG
ncbi:MAG: helix-turn-helix transcriptional regulator [Collinsella sp.]|nr:helix-turn-helix transcriptional regulator [Collinsella sp.]